MNLKIIKELFGEGLYYYILEFYISNHYFDNDNITINNDNDIKRQIDFDIKKYKIDFINWQNIVDALEDFIK